VIAAGGRALQPERARCGSPRSRRAASPASGRHRLRVTYIGTRTRTCTRDISSHFISRYPLQLPPKGYSGPSPAPPPTPGRQPPEGRGRGSYPFSPLELAGVLDLPLVALLLQLPHEALHALPRRRPRALLSGGTRGPPRRVGTSRGLPWVYPGSTLGLPWVYPGAYIIFTACWYTNLTLSNPTGYTNLTLFKPTGYTVFCV